MPPLPTLKINEIFSSLQGEGLRQGEPTIFIRLSGCNLRCSFCDTSQAWEEGRDMPLAEIISKIGRIHKKFPADWLCFTGGEPLLQDIQPLLMDLKTRGFLLQVETNATFDPVAPVDWYSVSPKPSAYDISPQLIHIAKEVKLVVTPNTEFHILQELREQFPTMTPLLLQPESNHKTAIKLCMSHIEKALLSGMKNIRISLQMHKLLGIK